MRTTKVKFFKKYLCEGMSDPDKINRPERLIARNSAVSLYGIFNDNHFNLGENILSTIHHFYDARNCLELDLFWLVKQLDRKKK